MTPVQLEIDDLDSGSLVILWKAAVAVLKATGQEKVVQNMKPTAAFPKAHTIERWPPLAQRNIWSAIDAGIVRGLLNPVVSVDVDKRNTHEHLSRGQCADGVVSFAELATWGHAIGLYNFIEPVATVPTAAQKVGAGETAVKVSLGDTAAIQQTPQELRAIAAASAKGAKREILEHWDAIARLHGPDADAAQVARHLKQQRDATDKTPSRKTIHNRLGELRRAKLIP